MRIAFVGLSGVRACDADLLRLGLSLPGFVARAGEIAAMPSLGLLMLAAVTPPGHELAYFEVPPGTPEPDALRGFDLVAIGTLTAQAPQAYAVADRLRAAGVTVAIGGLHATAVPDEAALHADHVVVGEGEVAWPLLVAEVERGGAGRIWRGTELPMVDLASLPAPRYDLLPGGHRRLTVQTTRGCPWRCGFCASTVMFGRPYRKRPVAHVARDVAAARAVAPEAFIELADDNTFVDKKWGKDLCRAIEPLGVEWFTPTDLSVADDPELLRLMRRAGCRQVLIGLESPSADALDGVEARSDFKRRVAGRHAEAVRRIQGAGITVNGCFVLGFDQDTPETFARVADYAEALGLYDVQVTVLTPFPGTPLYEEMLRDGRLTAPGAWERCTLFDVNFRPAGMEADQLRDGLRGLVADLYSAERTARRRRAFREQIVAGRRAMAEAA